MAVYRIYKFGCDGGFRTIRVSKINIPALLFGPFWLLWHGAYVEALGFMTLIMALWAGGLSLVFAVIFTNGLISWCSLEILDRRLRSRGWEYITSVEAEKADDSIKLFMDPFKSLKGA